MEKKKIAKLIREKERAVEKARNKVLKNFKVSESGRYVCELCGQDFTICRC